MPSKPQKPLPFQRTIIQHSTRSTATASNPLIALHTLASSGSLAPSIASTLTLAPQSPAPPFLV
jgi:hypothetical protein